MFSVELARIIFEDREREIREELRVRALVATAEPADERRRPSKSVLRPASQPARSR
jgi:hypothetical protein